jgi:exoribonuclease-2
LPRGARLLVKLGKIDEVALDLHGSVLARLDLAGDSCVTDEAAYEDDENAEVAGPIAIALDLTENQGEAGDGVPATDNPAP